MGKRTSWFGARLKMVLNIHLNWMDLVCVLLAHLSCASAEGMGNGTAKMSV